MINLSDIEELAPGFKDWLEEVEVYNSRYERLCYTLPDLSQPEWKDVMTWRPIRPRGCSISGLSLCARRSTTSKP